MVNLVRVFLLAIVAANQAAPATAEAGGGTHGLFEWFNERLLL